MPLKKLRDIIKLNSDNSQEDVQVQESVNEEERKRTYWEAGYGASQQNSGNTTALKINLETIYTKFQNEERENQVKQQKLKEPYFNELSEKNTEYKAKNVLLENKEENILEKNGKIETLKNEIAEIPLDPGAHGIDASKGSSVKFWIGLFLLIPISIYLIVFYMSASYSAFLKNWTPDDTIFQSIIDPQAFNAAWQESTLDGLFITFIPFVFMGLGYLIHMFGENKTRQNLIKVVSLIIITFAFDVILAYQIDENIYDLNKTPLSPEFGFAQAFQDVQFWGIIFAGFIVYIIWGLVFDFVMKENKERDKVKMAMNERKEKIKHLSDQIEVLQEERTAIKEAMQKLKGRMDELKRLIDSIVIPIKDYKSYASEFTTGYITFINKILMAEQKIKDERTNDCYEVYENHLKEIGASDDNYSLIYVNKN